MKRVIYYLRDLVWPSILATAFLVSSAGMLLFGAFAVAQVLALIGIAFAILSVRS